MRRLISGILGLLAGAYASHGQGFISLGDYGSPIATYLYVTYKTESGSSVPIGGSGAGPVPTIANYGLEIGNGTDWTVQLYGAVGANLPSSSLVPMPGMTANFANGINDKTSGTWASTAIGSFSDAGSGTMATVQLYAWYNDGGAVTSYSAALADGVPVGFSSTANVALGGPPGVPATLPTGLGNISFNNPLLLPEPSTMMLGVMGTSAFLMRLRRRLR